MSDKTNTIDEFFAQFDKHKETKDADPSPRSDSAEDVSSRITRAANRAADAEKRAAEQIPEKEPAPEKPAAEQTARAKADEKASDSAKGAVAGAAAAAGSKSGTTSRINAENNTEFYYGTAKAGASSSGRRHVSGTSTKRSGGIAAGMAVAAGRSRKNGASPRRTSRAGKPRKPPRNLTLGKSILSFALILCTMMVLGVGILVGIVFLKAPNIETDNIYSQIKQRSIVYDSKGNEIDALYFDGGNRTIVEYDQIPENMVNAIVSIEDQKFWTHHGFNFIRMVGAIRDSVFGGGGISGTSTISQQLARNFYLADIKSERTMGRKLTEMYITIILEKNLSKEKIMEAYLNTIYLGFNSYGVEAAAQSYFNKPVEKLKLLECASLAAIPQSPDLNALVIADYYKTITDLPIIKKTPSINYLYNGEASESRRNMVIDNMLEQGYISQKKHDKAMKQNLKKRINLGDAGNEKSSYFTDYAVSQLQQDIVEEYGVTETEAQNMIYSSGLKIYTTMDSRIQNILDDEFEQSENYTSIAYVSTNAEGDLINSDTGAVLLQSYDEYFDSKDRFVLKSDEYKTNDDGGITIKSGKRLNLYEIENNGAADVSIEFKSMYVNEDGVFYFIESGALSIPQFDSAGNPVKTLDEDGNCVISGTFFQENPDYFTKDGDNLIVNDERYTLKQKIRQPQAAAVIMENKTGQVKGMIGGRGATGKQLYNRAIHPRQPGSSIKPIGVYGPALQLSFEKEADGKTMKLSSKDGSSWGNYITAGSIINDKPMYVNGKQWPKNSGGGYSGKITLRRAVQQSVNVVAVKVFQKIGADWSVKMLKKNGITTLDEEGAVSDMNPAALALGGLTNGITPLELTAAYATFPNGGSYKTPIFYTKVLNSRDEVIMKKKAKSERVYDEGVAWIMTDILHSVVTQGIGSSAAIPNQPVGGKTGTTSDQYDIWFAGFTPQYTMALWEGNDVNIKLYEMSGAAARFWSAIMSRVCEPLDTESFSEKPDTVQRINGEYYTEGTYSRVKRGDDEDKDKKSSESKVTKSTTTKAPTTKAPTETTTTSPPTTEAPPPPPPTDPEPEPEPDDGGE